MFKYIFSLFIVILIAFIAYCICRPDEYDKYYEQCHRSPNIEEMRNDPYWCKKRKEYLTPETYDGIDVSHHNGKINWNKVALNKNIKYAYIKATEGKSFIDPKYKENIKNANKTDIKVGSYLFYRGNVSAIEQWNLFDKTVNAKQQDLVPMLDVEWGAFKKPLKEVKPDLEIIVNKMHNKYGKWPLIYCDDDLYADMHKYFPNCPIMVQNFLKYLPKDLDTPDCKDLEYTIWQFSESGKIDGIEKNVDLSKLRNKNSLNALIL